MVFHKLILNMLLWKSSLETCHGSMLWKRYEIKLSQDETLVWKSLLNDHRLDHGRASRHFFFEWPMPAAWIAIASFLTSSRPQLRRPFLAMLAFHGQTATTNHWPHRLCFRLPFRPQNQPFQMEIEISWVSEGFSESSEFDFQRYSMAQVALCTRHCWGSQRAGQAQGQAKVLAHRVELHPNAAAYCYSESGWFVETLSRIWVAIRTRHLCCHQSDGMLLWT